MIHYLNKYIKKMSYKNNVKNMILHLVYIFTWSIILPSYKTEAQDIIYTHKTVVDNQSIPTTHVLPKNWLEVKANDILLQYPLNLKEEAIVIKENSGKIIAETKNFFKLQQIEQITVRLTSDIETFNKVQPKTPPEWASGIAYPSLRLVVIQIPPLWKTNSVDFLANNYIKVFQHEIIHILLDDFYSGKTIPRWLNEGLAKMLAKEFSIDDQVIIGQAVLIDQLIPFHLLEKNFPKYENRANLAYIQSKSFLSYILERFGKEKFYNILNTLKNEGNLNEALWKETRHGLTELEDDWEKDLHKNYAWVSGLSGGISLWILTSILLFIAYIRKKYKNKKRRQKWEKEEAELSEKKYPIHYGNYPRTGPFIQGHFKIIQGGLDKENAVNSSVVDTSSDVNSEHIFEENNNQEKTKPASSNGSESQTKNESEMLLKRRLHIIRSINHEQEN